MPRPRRICVPGYPHHIVQRGNDRQATFYNEEDYATYLRFLGEAAEKFLVQVHAFALMTNHVHLLLTPSTTDGLSVTMQALGRRYVAYINRRYRRTGTLWEGRFKSSVVDTSHYCLGCYRYVDLNPVRAGIVTDPAAYRWTSYRINALEEPTSLLVPHIGYLQLGDNSAIRALRYRELVEDGLTEKDLNIIRYGTRKGLPVGSDQFKLQIERYLGRRLRDGRVGRPAAAQIQ